MAEASPAGARRRIIVLRHGETLDNAAGIWQGQRDTLLSEEGLSQARAAAPSLQMLAPDLLVSSDLARAAVQREIVGRRVDCRSASTLAFARSTSGDGPV